MEEKRRVRGYLSENLYERLVGCGGDENSFLISD